MECLALMERQPLANLGMLASGVVVGDLMDEIASWHRRLDRVDAAHELVMPVLVHATAGDLIVQHVG
jgi:hypothetical protein